MLLQPEHLLIAQSFLCKNFFWLIPPWALNQWIVSTLVLPRCFTGTPRKVHYDWDCKHQLQLDECNLPSRFLFYFCSKSVLNNTFSVSNDCLRAALSLSFSSKYGSSRFSADRFDLIGLKKNLKIQLTYRCANLYQDLLHAVAAFL